MIILTFMWLIVAVIILGCEMLLGTVYLLALSLGAFSACVAAFFSYSLTTQCSCAAIFTCICVYFAWYIKHNVIKNNKDTNSLDIGKRVSVLTIDPDGSSLVNYRGAQWKAFAKEGVLTQGSWIIYKVDGTNLILTKD